MSAYWRRLSHSRKPTSCLGALEAQDTWEPDSRLLRNAVVRPSHRHGADLSRHAHQMGRAWTRAAGRGKIAAVAQTSTTEKAAAARETGGLAARHDVKGVSAVFDPMPRKLAPRLRRNYPAAACRRFLCECAENSYQRASHPRNRETNQGRVCGSVEREVEG